MRTKEFYLLFSFIFLSIGKISAQQNTIVPPNNQTPAVGAGNVAVGTQSLVSNTTPGIDNVAVGNHALHLNTTGKKNIAIGYRPLFANLEGTDNIALGTDSQYYSTGSYNISIGTGSYGGSNYGTFSPAPDPFTTGSYNIAFGYSALRYNFSGESNIALGNGAGVYSTGSSNIFIGNTTGPQTINQVGEQNIVFGDEAGIALNGNKNILIGFQANAPATLPNNYLNIGNAIYGKNIYGKSSADGTTLEKPKIGIGTDNPNNTLEVMSILPGTSGFRITNLKTTALETGLNLLATDANGDVVKRNIAGTSNGFFWGLTGNAGTNAAVNFIGTTDNVDLVFKRSNIKAGFIGTTTTSLGNSSGSLGLNNTFIGADSGKNVFNPSGSNNNTAVGFQAGRSISGSVGGHSGLNTIMGYQAGFSVTGGKNTIIGSSSSVTSGSNNVVLGFGAGISSGSNNIVIGPGAGNVSPLNGQSNQLIIDADNSPNANPLIYGRFDTDNLVFNVNSGVTPFSSAVEINGRNQESGLRFKNLTSAFVPNATDTKFLTVETNGNVVLRNLPSGFTTTNTLASAANTMTSNVNGVTSSASIVNSLTTNVTGNTLTTTVNGVSSSVTLPSSSITDTDQQTLSVNGDQLTISNGNTVTLPSITEIDGDVTNELQTLSQNGNVVTLSNNGGSFSLPVDTDTDDQTLSINGTTLSISEGNSVEIPATALQAGDNITITGSGATADPYVISSTASGLNIYNSDGTIETTGTVGDNPNPGLRTVTMGNNNLFFNTASSSFDEDTAGSGRVYIGNTINFPNIDTTAPENSQYRLLVEGGVLTEKVKVALRSGTDWRDNVFEETYTLKPLSEVEAFIKENKHLPGIESASELVENGLDVGEMQAKQMEKIEELTLYTIEQQKILEKQQKEIEELKAQVKALLTKN